jgi:hypothetical protein
LTTIDVFNGDADGICALHQLRLVEPRPDANLLTGVKRDINLLARITTAPKLKITALDISFDKNRSDVVRLLEGGSQITYIDHHFSGDVPKSSQLTCHIDPDPQTCTSLIVDGLLHGAHRGWAIVGAFGDNLDEPARRLADTCNLKADDIDALRDTGILLNYNGYGSKIADLYFAPDLLYQEVRQFADPLLFHAESTALATLRKGYQEDMERAESAMPLVDNESGRIYQLADAPWSRRVGGVFANRLANQAPDRAHAILTENSDGTLRISVRAPLQRRIGADALCRRFPTGGGRSAAAGINHLPAASREDFYQAFTNQFAPPTE